MSSPCLSIPTVVLLASLAVASSLAAEGPATRFVDGESLPPRSSSFSGAELEDATSRSIEAVRQRAAPLLPSEFTANVQLVRGDGTYIVVGNGPQGVVASRIGTDGEIVDDPPFQVDRRGQVRTVAFDGTNVFVVYVDDPAAVGYGSILYGRRFTFEDGEPRLVDRSPIWIANSEFPVSGWIHEASVSVGTNCYLVSYSRIFNGEWDVAFVRVGLDGNVLDDPVSVPSMRSREEQPRTAFDGSRFIVAWISGSSLNATFIEPDTGDPSQEVLIATSPEGILFPEIEWSGSSYLVAWTDGDYSEETRLLAVRLSPYGQVIANPVGESLIELPTLVSPQTLASLSWDGSYFVLSWNEGSSDCRIDPCELPLFDMRSARIDADGRLRDVYPSRLGLGILTSQATAAPGRSLFTYMVDQGVRVGVGGTLRQRPTRR